MVRDKVRIRFRKAGDLRLISHHDLMRCFERMLRRAALPYHATAGFNPKPRCIFALSLPLGVIGSQEVADLELDEELPAEDIHARLAREAPAGLEILSVRKIDGKVTAHVRRVSYRIALPPSRSSDLSQRITELLQSPACCIERTRPKPRRIDLRPYVSDIRLSPDALEMDLFVSPTGTARPGEILDWLGLQDLVDNGGVLERTHVELEEECPSPLPAKLAGTEGACREEIGFAEQPGKGLAEGGDKSETGDSPIEEEELSPVSDLSPDRL